MPKKIKEGICKTTCFEQQAAWNQLMHLDGLSLTTLYKQVGLDYDIEMKNKKKELRDLKEIAFLSEQVYSPEKISEK